MVNGDDLIVFEEDNLYRLEKEFIGNNSVLFFNYCFNDHTIMEQFKSEHRHKWECFVMEEYNNNHNY